MRDGVRVAGKLAAVNWYAVTSAEVAAGACPLCLGQARQRHESQPIPRRRATAKDTYDRGGVL